MNSVCALRCFANFLYSDIIGIRTIALLLRPDFLWMIKVKNLGISSIVRILERTVKIKFLRFDSFIFFGKPVEINVRILIAKLISKPLISLNFINKFFLTLSEFVINFLPFYFLIFFLRKNCVKLVGINFGISLLNF